MAQVIWPLPSIWEPGLPFWFPVLASVNIYLFSCLPIGSELCITFLPVHWSWRRRAGWGGVASPQAALTLWALLGCTVFLLPESRQLGDGPARRLVETMALPSLHPSSQVSLTNRVLSAGTPRMCHGGMEALGMIRHSGRGQELPWIPWIWSASLICPGMCVPMTHLSFDWVWPFLYFF